MRKRILIAIGSAFAVMVLLLYLVSRAILLGSFYALEKRYVHRDVERVLNILEGELASLEATNADWATWDDTYAFMESVSHAYIASNLVDSTFSTLKLNVMLFVDTSGRVVYSRAFDLNTGQEAPVPVGLEKYLTWDGLLQPLDTGVPVKGILTLPEAPILLISGPILKSGGGGPARGVLITGRYLDASEVERLAEAAQVSLTVHQFGDPDLPSDLSIAGAALTRPFPRPEPVFSQPLNSSIVVGYALLRDIYGQPALILRVEQPRDIYRQGQISMFYLIFLFLVSGLAFTGVSSWMADRVVISRLMRLSAEVDAIGASGDLSTRVTVAGKDELASLAHAVNEMLRALERSHLALQESEQRFQDVALSTGDWIWEVDAQGRYTYVNPVVAQVLGYTPEEVLGRHYSDFLTPQSRAELTSIQQLMQADTCQMVHKDGRFVHFKSSALPLRDGSGNLLGWRGVHRDVTAERQMEERVATIYLLGRELVLSRNEEQIAQATVAAVRLILAPRRAGIWLVDEEGKKLDCRACHPEELEAHALSLEDENHPLVSVVRSGTILYVPDFRNHNGQARSLLCVPLSVKGQVIGALGAESDQAHACDRDTQRLLVSLADQAALAIENARLYEQMRAAHDRLQALSNRLVEVQEAERRHIARELHDEIGQLLTGLKLLIEVSTLVPDAEAGKIRSNLKEAQALVNELMTRVRDLSLGLRQTPLDELGLLTALRWHFERYTAQTGVRVVFKHKGVERKRFAPQIETAAYRVVQEALTNVARHAHVDHVTVRLWADHETLGIQVEDQGRGFDSDAVLNDAFSGGLSGMSERVTLLGGRLTVESKPGSGTRVTAEIPLSGSSEMA